jgi:hypothetical protein
MEIVFRDQDSYININNMSKDQSNIYLSGRRVCRYQREVLYDKNSESDFLSPPPKSEYYFQQHWESEYFF